MKYSYDKKEDILYVFDDKETVRGSIDVFPGFVVDISHSYKVIGLEIFDASKVFGVPKRHLGNLKNIRLTTLISHNYYGFIFTAKTIKKEIHAQVSSPLKVSIPVSR